MGEKLDDLKGRAKEAAGDLTDDESLQREGKVDQGKAEVKEKVGEVTDKIGDKIKDITN
ncbi:MAG TPA: CsbD family protein [Acidimicrobiales bacterium]|nr:CsbD family protein [Acidimicrobiales bacterium]